MNIFISPGCNIFKIECLSLSYNFSISFGLPTHQSWKCQSRLGLSQSRCLISYHFGRNKYAHVEHFSLQPVTIQPARSFGSMGSCPVPVLALLQVSPLVWDCTLNQGLCPLLALTWNPRGQFAVHIKPCSWVESGDLRLQTASWVHQSITLSNYNSRVHLCAQR